MTMLISVKYKQDSVDPHTFQHKCVQIYFLLKTQNWGAGINPEKRSYAIFVTFWPSQENLRFYQIWDLFYFSLIYLLLTSHTSMEFKETEYGTVSVMVNNYVNVTGYTADEDDDCHFADKYTIQ